MIPLRVNRLLVVVLGSLTEQEDHDEDCQPDGENEGQHLVPPFLRSVSDIISPKLRWVNQATHIGASVVGESAVADQILAFILIGEGVQSE